MPHPQTLNPTDVELCWGLVDSSGLFIFRFSMQIFQNRYLYFRCSALFGDHTYSAFKMASLVCLLGWGLRYPSQTSNSSNDQSSPGNFPWLHLSDAPDTRSELALLIPRRWKSPRFLMRARLAPINLEIQSIASILEGCWTFHDAIHRWLVTILA